MSYAETARDASAAYPANRGPVARSDETFRERPLQKLARWTLGLAYACHPKRICHLPVTLLWCAADIARGGTRIPDPARVRPIPDTFGGVARDVTPDTVLAAARLGFFPWCHIGPLKWWTRRERMVLRNADFHIPKNMRRMLRKTSLRVTFDTAFADVIKACAGQRKNRPYGLTWITPKIMRLYTGLHAMGHAHSFEVWNADGVLVGGGYGLSAGRVFYTESLFSHETDSSKLGFAVLAYHLTKWGYVLNDGKDWSTSLAAKGFHLMPRGDFEAILAQHAQGTSPAASWRVDTGLLEIAKWEPKGLVTAAHCTPVA